MSARLDIHQELSKTQAMRQGRQTASDYCTTVWVLSKDGRYHCTASRDLKNARLKIGYDLVATIQPEDVR